MLRDCGHRVERERAIDVYFRRRQLGHYRADLIAESAVLLEINSGEQLHPAAQTQLLNDLRATNIEVEL